MSKGHYQKVLEGFKQALANNPKLSLRKYCRIHHLNISAMGHYIYDDLHVSIKQIREEVLGKDSDVTAEPSSFIKVVPPSPAKEAYSAPLEIHFPSGARLLVGDGSLDMVEALIDKLYSCG